MVFRLEALDLQCRWAGAVDAGDWDTVLACFMPAATAHLPKTGSHSSAAAIVAASRPIVCRLDAVHHHLGGQHGELAGDAVLATTSVIAHHVRGGSSYTFGGRYTDRIVRDGSSVRIADRQLAVLWTRGDPTVLDI